MGAAVTLPPPNLLKTGAQSVALIGSVDAINPESDYKDVNSGPVLLIHEALL